MKTESESTDFEDFKSSTKDEMRSELKNLLQKHSNFNWEITDSNIVIPKKIELRRIISAKFESGHRLLQTTRTIERSVTRIGFAINSNINLINLENKMQKELEALKAEIESLKVQLSSKADNSALQNVESNLSQTIGNVQSIASDAVSRANNAQNTANDAVDRANNAQNTANDAVNRVQQLEAKTHAISHASDGGTWISAGDQYTLAIQVDGNIVRYKNGTSEAKSLLD
jgi:hypothetical protein